MEVVAAGHRQQRKALAALDIAQIALDIATIADVQVGRNLTVHAVIDDHVEHGASGIDDTRELIACLLYAVANLDQARGHSGAAGGLLQHITTVGRHDIVPIGAQQGDVLHDNLAAHTHLTSKCAARYGPLGPLEHGHDGTATLAGVHYLPSSRRRCLSERSRIGAECVNAPELM